MTPILAALLGMCLIGGTMLLVAGMQRNPVSARPMGTPTGSRRLQKLFGSGHRMTQRTKLLLAAGIIAGLIVWLLSGWIIAVLILPTAFAGLPTLLVAPASKAEIERVSAMEEWTRGLAGVLTVGVGLDQALIATLRSTPEAIKPEVSTLVARIQGRWDTVTALRAFADDLDDATGDLIAGSLRLGASRQGSGLAAVLQGLAQTVAEDVRMRRAVEADRAKPRTTARWVTIISIGALAYLTLNSSYIAPYGSPIGQLVLLVLLSAYIGALLWMRQMAQGEKPPRFIGKSVTLRGESR